MVKRIALGCFALFMISLMAEVASAQLFFRRRQCATGNCNTLAYSEPTVTIERVVRAEDGGLQVFTEWHGPVFGKYAKGKWSHSADASRQVFARERRFRSLRIFPTYPS